MLPISMGLRAWMVAHPCCLAIEANGFDLRVHRETTRALADRPLLEHGEDLLEHSCHFRLSRVHSPKDHVGRYKCADLQSHLAVDGSQYDPSPPEAERNLVPAIECERC